MDTIQLFEDFSQELNAVKNRIRNLIGDAHWPTDGIWKESFLRSILRRYLPLSWTIGSGFIVTPKGTSKQIDILICDDQAPIFFRDGDFIIATRECVRAVIEVKTKLSSISKITQSLKKLEHNAQLLHGRNSHHEPFVGMFCYESTTTKSDSILKQLTRKKRENRSLYEICSLCFGNSQFYKFWHFDPNSTSKQPYDHWHAYDLKNLAPGYFIHNVIERLFPDKFRFAERILYPENSKEANVLATREIEK
jgi:hypothetical protein